MHQTIRSVIDAIRRKLRRALPARARLRVALCRRSLVDHVSGTSRLLVRTQATVQNDAAWARRITVTQPIRRSEHWQGKVENIRLAASRLSGVEVKPGEIFSFWLLAGEPCASNGYRIGRSILSDVLGADIGGGLCQISGLAYELGLRAGLRVIERHPHTQDLYDEETRFTPLGLDATVVWGYKDLRLQHLGSAPLAFAFEVGDDVLTGAIQSAQAIEPAELDIVRTDEARRRTVRVVRRMAGRGAETVSIDSYAIAK